MPVITRIVVLFLALIIAGGATEARAEKKLKVIASFSILGDMDVPKIVAAMRKGL